jgi:hypothetical protein
LFSVNVIWLILLNVNVCAGGDCDGTIDTTNIGDDASELVGKWLYLAFDETKACDLTTKAVWGTLPREKWYDSFLTRCKPAYCTWTHPQEKIDRAMDAFAVVTSFWGILFIIAGLLYGPLNALLSRRNSNNVTPQPTRAFE